MKQVADKKINEYCIGCIFTNECGQGGNLKIIVCPNRKIRRNKE